MTLPSSERFQTAPECRARLDAQRAATEAGRAAYMRFIGDGLSADTAASLSSEEAMQAAAEVMADAGYPI